MMNLETYLRDHDVSDTVFANAIGISRVSVWRLRKGKQSPSLKTAQRIERETNGKVLATSWVDASSQEKA